MTSGDPPIRPDLAEVLRLRDAQLDAARPASVEKRRRLGRWTARENVDRFLDPDSFVEYGRLAKPLRPDMEGASDGVVLTQPVVFVLIQRGGHRPDNLTRPRPHRAA